MNPPQHAAMLAELADGRTDLVFNLLAEGCPPSAKDAHGVSLLQHCAYFGDVTALKLLLGHGEALSSLGPDLGLTGAAFHGHWRLAKFLLEQGADVNYPMPDSAETPLHAALVKTDRLQYDPLVRVLLAHGANPNAATTPGAETGGFMRDCRTRGETPLHRAAAFGEAGTITMLLEAGAKLDARDANGDSPLTWGSWHQRPADILRLLCFDGFRIHPGNRPMRANLIGDPHPLKR